ncbi:cyrochrome P450 monooxygenase [Colletotrichum liriopes]|uniref:Cyrochrome P450 monooxygenase n=1 Tax=Colletotrichum liriopes TaxID=708192 RepID=A0AA37GWJ8_9PEZI|nr:cyrochrome P450 monooxygenase [Colletotrichum liriopes]
MSTIETSSSPIGVSTSYLSARTVLGLVGVWLVYQFFKALYNVSPLHPLSHIPGPKLSAATYIPEFYYDVILFGRYTREIHRMHEQYGPIVRINPHEVHCNDVNFSDEIYAVSGRKRDKPVHQINGSALGESGFGTVDHDIHRVRRIPLAKFFSRSMISRLEGDVHALVQKLCDKLLAETDKKPFDVTMAYSCFTSDAISGYCFGESFGFLTQEDWYPNFRAPTASILRPVFIFRFFPWTKHFAVLGEWYVPFRAMYYSFKGATLTSTRLVDYLPADVALLIRTLKMEIPNKVNRTKADLDAGIRHERPTVFGSLLESDLESVEKGSLRLADEAAAVVGAGTETTSWALAVITYHLLTKPQLLKKLQDELKSVVDDPKHLPGWTSLEGLPYLGAVLQEGLRLSYGVSARTARVPTEENLVYRGEFNKKPVEYVVPRGYAIGMSAVVTHHDESVFPDSYQFIPERWLDENNQRRKDVEKGMLAFSKGSRSCLGMNLALCELNLCLTALALRVLPTMRLYETTDEDVAYDHDMFVPVPKAGTNGVRVKMV